jgi:hypothetical protein
MTGKHVSNRTPCNGQERRPRDAVQEARNQHRFNIARQCAWYHPDEEEAKRSKVDGAPAVELLVSLLNVYTGEKQTSESGLSTIGPAPSPATKSDNPSVHTILDAPNSGSSCPYVEV